jgi:hypothetical protein
MDLFEWVSDEIERATSLDRLAARGTVRIALREAGLEPSSLDQRQLVVVLERVLPAQLAARGVADAESVCAGLRTRLPSAAPRASGDTPETIFHRLAGPR